MASSKLFEFCETDRTEYLRFNHSVGLTQQSRYIIVIVSHYRWIIVEDKLFI